MTLHTLAVFITPHGFGHATRQAAILAAIHRRDPAVRFEIFTRVPRWLLEQSLNAPFGYHEVLTDIGLAQRDALHEDIPETLRRLDEFIPFRPALVSALAHKVTALGCDLLVCDIAPLGIAVAQAAGIPSALVENFTWDWIYAGYAADHPRLQPHIEVLRGVYQQATYHLQTEPVCAVRANDLLSAPVSRSPHQPSAAVRAQLSVPQDAPLVLISMGGLSAPDQHAFLDQLTAHPDVYFILPGAGAGISGGNVIGLPNHSAIYHPDLMGAADALVGKSGYSTVAEAYHAGVPYGYVSRPHFRESDVMAAYIQAHMRGIEFREDEFRSGQWLSRLPELLGLGRRSPQHPRPNGADQVAEFLLNTTG